MNPACAAALLGALACAGCVSHAYQPLQGDRAAQGNRMVPAAFQSTAANGHQVRLGEERPHGDSYTRRRVVMPAGFENGQPGNRLTGTYYASVSPGRKPLVVVLPVWGVSAYPSARMTDTVLRRSNGSMNVLLIHGARRLVDWQRVGDSDSLAAFEAALSNAAERLRHAVIDLRRLVDWAVTRPEVHGKRIGIAGFSVSAVIASLVVQVDNRLRAAALVMGGAGIDAIVSNCPGNEARARRRVMERLGLDQGEYRRTIAAAFEGVDPLDYAGRADPRRILMVDAAKDDCIPRTSREAWWEALGQPARITLNYGHRASFLAMTPLGLNFLRRRIYRHFIDTL